MRIRVVQRPTISVVDGINLKRFVPGRKYDVGTGLGTLMLAEGWAEPAEDSEPTVAPSKAPNPIPSRAVDRSSPPNLIRESHPPSLDTLPIAADFERRTRRGTARSSQN
jgi:hypothetical protein